MTLVDILLMLVAGVLTSNCVIGSASGVDLALNGFQSKKQTMIYFCVITCVTLFSALSSWVLSLVLSTFAMSSFIFFGNLLIVAMYSQIAEYICTKTAPLFNQF